MSSSDSFYAFCLCEVLRTKKKKCHAFIRMKMRKTRKKNRRYFIFLSSRNIMYSNVPKISGIHYCFENNKSEWSSSQQREQKAVSIGIQKYTNHIILNRERLKLYFKTMQSIRKHLSTCKIRVCILWLRASISGNRVPQNALEMVEQKPKKGFL